MKKKDLNELLRVVCLVIFISLFALSSSAQYFGLNGKVQIPTGSFNQNIDQKPVGFSISYLHQMKDSRFSLGGEFGVAMYSNNSYSYHLIEEGYPGEYVTVAEEDCFWTVHAIGRYNIVETANFKTFAALRAGVTTFFSTREPLDADDRIDAEFNIHGTAFNTGFGAGAAINPKGLISRTKSGRLWIELVATYNGGSRTSYRHMTESSSPVNASSQGQYRSLTNYFDFKLGLVFDMARR